MELLMITWRRSLCLLAPCLGPSAYWGLYLGKWWRGKLLESLSTGPVASGPPLPWSPGLFSILIWGRLWRTDSARDIVPPYPSGTSPFYFS